MNNAIRYQDLKGKQVTVIGSGESGMASLRLLNDQGLSARCSTTDKLSPKERAWCVRKKILVEEGGHSASFLKGSDLIVLSPGVKPNSHPIKYARRHKISLWSELQLAAVYNRVPWVAVTGTNGKTTTTTLLTQILNQKFKASACGNIGNSFSGSLLRKPSLTLRVVEASSFQLKYASQFVPSLSILLNLSPNHLDWHASLKDYYDSKLNIAKHMTREQCLVVNQDDEQVMKAVAPLKVRKIPFSRNRLRRGLYLKDHQLRFADGRQDRLIAELPTSITTSQLQENVLAAVLASHLMGASRNHIQRTLNSFKPLSHRMEHLGIMKGIHFINDSKSTTVASTLAALESCNHPVLLLAGGRLKQKSFRQLLPALRSSVESLILYGESRHELGRQLSFDRPHFKHKRFDAAVRQAIRLAKPGDTILLSPIGASFDQFESYEARGNEFRRLVKDLMQGGEVLKS